MLAELDELAAEVERIREESARVEERLERLPADRAAARDRRAEAEAVAHERRSAHGAAEAELAEAEARGDDARLAAGRRDELRARDLLRSAERRLERAKGDEERLYGVEAELRRRAEELVERAREIAAELGERPGLADAAAPPATAAPADLGTWATETRAALFVARGRLAAERDAVIRQANELGALVLGEPLTAQSAALVARRVEQSRLR